MQVLQPLTNLWIWLLNELENGLELSVLEGVKLEAEQGQVLEASQDLLRSQALLPYFIHQHLTEQLRSLLMVKFVEAGVKGDEVMESVVVGGLRAEVLHQGVHENVVFRPYVDAWLGIRANTRD
jgi:hypothetical protein